MKWLAVRKAPALSINTLSTEWKYNEHSKCYEFLCGQFRSPIIHCGIPAYYVGGNSLSKIDKCMMVIKFKLDINIGAVQNALLAPFWV